MSNAQRQPVSVDDEFECLWGCLHILPDDSVDFALAQFMRDNRATLARALRLLHVVENPTDKLLDMIYDVSQDNEGGGYAILERLLHWPIEEKIVSDEAIT